MPHPKVSVVIPALNEAENLRHVLPRVPRDVHEVILVDGFSQDDTIAEARVLLPTIRVVFQDGPGKGAALQAGFRAATGEVIVMLDADGSTDPAEIPAFVQALCAGADFAKGSRFLPGGGTADMPRYRQLGNRSFVVLVRLLYGGRYTDLCYGYNAFWKSVLPTLAINASGFEVETMMNIRALRAGLKVTEVPSFEARRIYGEGRLRTIPDGWRVLKTIFGERFRPVSAVPIAERHRTPVGVMAPGHDRVGVPVEVEADSEVKTIFGERFRPVSAVPIAERHRTPVGVMASGHDRVGVAVEVETDRSVAREIIGR